MKGYLELNPSFPEEPKKPSRFFISFPFTLVIEEMNQW